MSRPEYNYKNQISKALWGLGGSLLGMVVAEWVQAKKAAPYTIIGGAAGALIGFYQEAQQEQKRLN